MLSLRCLPRSTLAALLLLGSMAGAAAEFDAPPSLAAPLRRAMPYVVSVYGVDADGREAHAPSPADRPGVPSAAAADTPFVKAHVGAGIALGDGGRIATAAHLVRDTERILVKLPDDRIVEAAVLAVDDEADIAVLVVPARWPAAAPFGRSAGLQIGDWVVAIGEPYGLERSAMPGIVSGARRHFAEDQDVVFIQTSIAVGPGHSGGALVDAQGYIVGMNLRGVVGPYGSAGLGLAVPIELVLQVAREAESGRVLRPRLAVRFEDLLPVEAFEVGLARASGAVVREVEPGGLGDRLGMRAGDIVTGLNGQPVGDGAELARLLRTARSSDRLRMVVFRDGGYLALRLTPALDAGQGRPAAQH